MRKERLQQKKSQKNVTDAFKVEGDDSSYDMDKVLANLGEGEKKKKNSKTANISSSTSVNGDASGGKAAKKSKKNSKTNNVANSNSNSNGLNGNSVMNGGATRLDAENNSASNATTSDEEEAEADEKPAPNATTANVNGDLKVEQPPKKQVLEQEPAVQSNDESVGFPGELKRQTSRSTEDLLFTTVTSKKQKWRKQKMSKDDSGHAYSSALSSTKSSVSSMSASSTIAGESQQQHQHGGKPRNTSYNLRSRSDNCFGGEKPKLKQSQSFDTTNGRGGNHLSSAGSSVAASAASNSTDTLDDTASSASGPGASAQHKIAAKAKDLDLAADFPPLATASDQENVPIPTPKWVIPKNNKSSNVVVDNSKPPPPAPSTTAAPPPQAAFAKAVASGTAAAAASSVPASTSSATAAPALPATFSSVIVSAKSDPSRAVIQQQQSNVRKQQPVVASDKQQQQQQQQQQRQDGHHADSAAVVKGKQQQPQQQQQQQSQQGMGNSGPTPNMPDVTVINRTSTVLPDVAAQAPINSAGGSQISSSNASASGDLTPPLGATTTRSFVQPQHPQHVQQQQSYNSIGNAVVMFGDGQDGEDAAPGMGPEADQPASFEFGYGVNVLDLMQPPPSQPPQLLTQAIHHDDEAIVGFGGTIAADDSGAASEANYDYDRQLQQQQQEQEQQHRFSNNPVEAASPESGVGMSSRSNICSPTDLIKDDNVRVIQASPLPQQQQQATKTTINKAVKEQEILDFVSALWARTERELSSGIAVRYELKRKRLVK